MINNINTYSEFVLNETLKTHDIDLTIRNVNRELSLLRYNFKINKINNNTISIELLNFNKLFGISRYLNNLNNLLIDRHGWFPSYMNITNFSGNIKMFPYNEDKLLDDNDNLYYEKVEIIYESKYDISLKMPTKLYHISIEEYKNSILKKGILCKSKSKLSNHLDRIYVCSDINKCYNLISQMKFFYNNKKINNRKNKINDNWIIYEIDSSKLDIKLYKDPNYNKGFYIVENIPKELITIIDEE